MNITTIARANGASRASRVEVVCLGGLVAFTVVALTGYGVFGLQPARLASLPPILSRFYSASFGFFAQAQVVLAALVMVLILRRRARWHWVPAFVVLYCLSLSSELAGTSAGVPFGAYSYTDLLGPRWFGLVPVLVPLSWFMMAVPSYALGREMTRGRGGRLARVLAGSFVLMAWDFSLDPAMSHLTRYWVWGEAGPYYGMPLLNLFGWYVTGLALMVALAFLRADAWLERIPVRVLAGYYAANLLLPFGMNMLAGLGAAVVAGLVPLALPATALLRQRRPMRVAAPAAIDFHRNVAVAPRDSEAARGLP